MATEGSTTKHDFEELKDTDQLDEQRNKDLAPSQQTKKQDIDKMMMNGDRSHSFAETANANDFNGSVGVEKSAKCSSLEITSTDCDSIINELQNVNENGRSNHDDDDGKNKSDDESVQGVKQTTSAMKCEMCNQEEAKYTCPRCSVQTCCVACVNQHKERLACNGQRDKTAFVSSAQYSDMHLLNDYRFLENAERTVYSNKISNNKQRHTYPAPYNHINKRSKLLMAAAQKRGVRLRMVSMALSKHKNNTSYYQMSSDRIEWHIEWQFVLSNTLVKGSKVPESSMLIEAARKFTNFTEFPHLRKTLEVYKKQRLDQCRFLLKIEGLPANRNRFYSLDPQATVADNLKGHCLTEYPTIYVLTPEAMGQGDYSLLSQEDLTHMQRDLARHMVLHHKELDASPKLQAQLMNPASHLYQPTST